MTGCDDTVKLPLGYWAKVQALEVLRRANLDWAILSAELAESLCIETLCIESRH